MGFQRGFPPFLHKPPIKSCSEIRRAQSTEREKGERGRQVGVSEGKKGGSWCKISQKNSTAKKNEDNYREKEKKNPQRQEKGNEISQRA